MLVIATSTFAFAACAVRAGEVVYVVLPAGTIDELVAPGAVASEVAAIGPEDTLLVAGRCLGCDPVAPAIIRITTSGVINQQLSIPEFDGQPAYTYDVRGLAMGQGGEIWFTADVPGGQSFIGRVTSTGGFTEVGVPGEPTAIATEPEGNAWYINPLRGTIGNITRAGEFVEQSAGRPGSELTGIARGMNESMWFTIAQRRAGGANALDEITPEGELSEFVLAPGSLPAGLALGLGGDMWFTEPGPNEIGRITPSDRLVEFAAPSVGGTISAEPDGTMWFSEAGDTNAIGRITPAGIVTSFAPVSKTGVAPTDVFVSSEAALWLWSSEQLARFVVPPEPISSGLPVVSGEPLQGQTLSATVGSWLHEPSAFAYQWQACDAAGLACTDLPGEVAMAHSLTAGDVGHTLRVVVTASNIGGSSSAVSSVSGVVGPAPPSEPHPSGSEPPPPPPESRIPTILLRVIGASMTWKFGSSRQYTVVKSLVFRGLPAQASVEINCAGSGCAFRDHAWTSATTQKPCHGRACVLHRKTALRDGMNLSSVFKGHHLVVGTRISLTVEKAGMIGKSFVFTTRSSKAPNVTIGCLSLEPNTIEAC